MLKKITNSQISDILIFLISTIPLEIVGFFPAVSFYFMSLLLVDTLF